MIDLQSLGSTGDQAVMRLGMGAVRQVVRQLCEKDFLIFQKVELGLEIGPQHHTWAKHLETGQDVCEMAPRDHGKSLSLAQAYPLWKAKYSRWTKDILILGPDQSLAIRNLDKIKELLETRPSLAGLIPKKKKEGFYSRTEIKLANGKVIQAKGIGSPLRGRHPQLIIMDDVLNEDNSLDPEHQLQIKRYFEQVVVPMKDKGLAWMVKQGFGSQIVIIGTAQDRNDLYHDLQKNPEYIEKKLTAIIDEDKKIVLWPERYSYEDLMKLKRKIGSLSFSKEYMNEPITDETSLFPTTLFEPLKDQNLSYARLYEGQNPVYLGADFSVPGSTDGDWTVIVAIELDQATNQFVLLNYWRAKPQEMQQQIHEIELWCHRYKVTLGYLEDNLFQGVYASHFANRSTLPLSGHTVGRNKTNQEMGILSFRPQFENMAWRFPYKTPEDKTKTDLIVTEFNGITQRRGKIGNESFHDDIVMALWHAVSAARTGTSFSASF